MKKFNLIIIIIILFVIILFLNISGIFAFGDFFENQQTIINIDGNDLILPDNYTYICGNGSDIVKVKTWDGQIFAITTKSLKEYYGSDENYTELGNGYDVTGIHNFDADNLTCACVINDNGTHLIIDFIYNKDKYEDPYNVQAFTQDLQNINGLQRAGLQTLKAMGIEPELRTTIDNNLP